VKVFIYDTVYLKKVYEFGSGLFVLFWFHHSTGLNATCFNINV